METVTRDNIDRIKESIAGDQAREIIEGCETWAIYYQPGNQRGQMTRWPNGRGAVCYGGDSAWGDWQGELLILDDGDSTPINQRGDEVTQPTEDA